MQHKFKNKNGSLTPYAFACGYSEDHKVKDSTISLFRDGCWHVQVRSEDKGRFIWECFDLLTDARKFVSSTKRSIKNNQSTPKD